MATNIQNRWAVRELRHQVTTLRGGAFTRGAFIDVFAPWLSKPLSLMVVAESEAGLVIDPAKLVEACQQESDRTDRQVMLAFISADDRQIRVGTPSQVRALSTDLAKLIIDTDTLPTLEDVLGAPRSRRTA